ncbi:MAG: cyclodeaminase/cyclohydrolase family protein [Armatimonadota bacterium]|nr:MAG: cyclodeaminase/cyclohydrolase family protein [Armatimonadota bacterium]
MADAIREPMGEYLDRLAAKLPAPGGGSAAALVGALGAALESMVANFTVGKEAYREVEDDVKTLLEQSEALRGELSKLVQADMDVYSKVSSAYGLPRETAEQKAARTEAIQAALEVAAQVPHKVVKACDKVLSMCPELAAKGSANLISDVGVAVVFAEAALQAAYLNVEINLAGIRNEAYNEQVRRELTPLVERAAKVRAEVWQHVMAAVRK